MRRLGNEEESLGKKQRELIHKKNWDVLVVLDACRYDVFERVYGKYLEGNLKRIRSSGGATVEWLENTFGENHYDFDYYSANPHINSKPNEHNWGFEKVYDGWLEAWSASYGTVLPRDMTEYVLDNAQGSRKKIVHYMQPHVPFIGLGKVEGYFKGREKIMGNMRFKRIRSYVGEIAERLLGSDRIDRIREKLGLRVNPYDVIKEKCNHNDDVIKEKYKENLELALKSISHLVSKLGGKKVVTSDHGELLGEDGRYGHFEENHPVLRQVPWLVVE